MDVMDELNIKDDRPRVHPEDAAATSDSGRSEEEQDTDRELELSDDENYQIPGTSDRDHTMFKNSSKFAGKFNTVSRALRPSGFLFGVNHTIHLPQTYR